MRKRDRIVRELHDRIVGELHVGRVKAGDSLPSIRELARLMRKNPRTVKAAYQHLAAENLVTVRGRSGVFVATQDIPGSESSGELTRWMAQLLVDGWSRHIQPAQLS